jgi:integrase/recombinase XerD
MKKFVTSSEWCTMPQKDFAPILSLFRRSLERSGLKTSTIESYLWRVNAFLEFAKCDKPPVSAFDEFRQGLFDKKLSLSAINNSSFAIKRFYAMIGSEVSFEFVKPHDAVPFYFNDEDVAKIFHACSNIKHRAIMETLFYACLRSSELCGLDVEDVDLEALTIRLRETKRGDRNDIAYINGTCAKTLRQYLQIRPPLEIDGRKPLFYTDFGLRWDHKKIYRLFKDIKKRAGVDKQGCVHVFSRHTPATLMISRGCDIRIVQKLLRHNDIRTTLRYAHVSDKTQREAYDKFLTL